MLLSLHCRAQSFRVCGSFEPEGRLLQTFDYRTCAAQMYFKSLHPIQGFAWSKSQEGCSGKI
eukprot:3775209-Pyramimonas_sp.AAC.1